MRVALRGGVVVIEVRAGDAGGEAERNNLRVTPLKEDLREVAADAKELLRPLLDTSAQP